MAGFNRWNNKHYRKQLMPMVNTVMHRQPMQLYIKRVMRSKKNEIVRKNEICSGAESPPAATIKLLASASALVDRNL